MLTWVSRWNESSHRKAPSRPQEKPGIREKVANWKKANELIYFAI